MGVWGGVSELGVKGKPPVCGWRVVGTLTELPVEAPRVFVIELLVAAYPEDKVK